MNDDLLPYTPRHSHEAKRGYPQPRRKWDPKPRMCSNCGVRRVYLQDVETMDWCEHCLWESVQEDQLSSDSIADNGEQKLSGSSEGEKLP
jgi:hypothetical protein